jgi:hypothetical protein
MPGIILQRFFPMGTHKGFRHQTGTFFQIQKDDPNGRLAWFWKKREIRSPSFGEMDDAYP